MLKKTCMFLALLVALAPAAYPGDPQIGGLLQARYVDEGDKDSQFMVKAARLKVGAQITDRITGNLQVDFARDPLILDAYVDFTVVDYANFTAGQFKIPFGYEFQLPRFYLEAIERSMIMKTAFGNGISNPYVRDVGLMLHGRFKLLNYQVAAVNGTGYDYHGLDVGDRSVFADWNNDNNNTKDLVGRIGVGIPMFAGLGFSMYEGSWTHDREKSSMGFYFHIDTGKVLFQYEWLRGTGYLSEAEYAPLTSGDWITDFTWQDKEYGGYYIVVGYRVTPLIQPTFKIDKLDPDKDEGGDNLTDFYYGLNLNFQRAARLQVFYRDSEEDGDFIGKGWRAQVSAMF
jgi:hypothetical protein